MGTVISSIMDHVNSLQWETECAFTSIRGIQCCDKASFNKLCDCQRTRYICSSPQRLESMTLPPHSISWHLLLYEKYANDPIFKDYSKSFLNLFAARFAALLVGSSTSAY